MASIAPLPFTCRPSPPCLPVDGAAEGTVSAAAGPGGIGMICVIVGSAAGTAASTAATDTEWRIYSSIDNGAPAVLFCVAPSHLMSVIVALMNKVAALSTI